MREVSRKEFQKRIQKEIWTTKEIVGNYHLGKLSSASNWIPVNSCLDVLFNKVEIAGLVVFDRKELSLSIISKERSLRKLFQEIYTKIGHYSVDASSQEDMKHFDKLGLMIDKLKQAFDEHFAEDKRFLGDLQKALDARPSHKWMIRNLDKIEDVEICFLKLEKLFSGFQGTFFSDKEASPKTEKGQ